MSHLSLAGFADKINQIMPVIAKEFMHLSVNELCRGKITIPQFFILNFLNTAGDSKMKDIASFIRVTTAAMTGIVERLVRRGYVERVFNLTDRRIIKIKLTAKAKALVKKVNAKKRRAVMKIFGKISQADRKEYLRIITKIRDTLNGK